MKGSLAITGIFIFCAMISWAQDLSNIEYGKTDELKGVTKVFVNTRGDKKSHDEVAHRIEKELPGVTVKDTPDDAEVILIFLGDTYGGDGVVYKVSTKGRSRVLMDWKGSKGRYLGRDLEKRFAEAFIEAYRKVNKPYKESTPIPATSTSAAGQNDIKWQLIADMKDYAMYYSPQTMMEDSAGRTRVWSKLVFKADSAGRGDYIATRRTDDKASHSYEKFMYAKQLVECDCTQRKYRMLALVDYSSDNRVLGSLEGEGSDWSYVVPETPIYQLIDAMCSRKK